jgi:hypothetical protein
VELLVILPLPLEQCHAVVESLRLNYPLYANPNWSVFDDYGSGHVLYAPKQSWIGIDEAGVVQYVWRLGDDGELRRVPLPLEALEAFEAALA